MKPASANPVPGVIETLSGGFDHVNHILYIVLVPIVMDLFLWLGPRVSAEPVFTQLARWYSQVSETYLSVAGGDPSTMEQARQAMAELPARAGHFNLLTLLVTNIASVPSILPSGRSDVMTYQIGSLGVAIGVVLATQVLGILIGCLYLGVMGQQVRDGRVALAALGRRIWFYWLSVVGFLLLVVGSALLISLPIGLAIGLIQLVAPAVGAVLWYLALAGIQIAAILVLVYLFFLVDAIIVSEVGPVRAAVSSARVVASNFWSTVGFIGLVYIISLGMQVIWTTLSHSPIGTVIAIVGNAYIASGLAAASLLYYKTRAARLPATSQVLGRVST